MPSIVFITGMSGSGKTQVLKTLEDEGYYCIDNIPTQLIPQLVDIISYTKEIRKVSMVVDIRDKSFAQNFLQTTALLRDNGYDFRILFVDASNEVILRRYKETRRRHPLDGDSITESIENERKILEKIRVNADILIDTTDLNVHQLKAKITKIFGGEDLKEFSVVVTSFGYKFGIPTDSDMVIDTRFLKNPNFVPELKKLDGGNKKIKDFILTDEKARKYIDKIQDLVDFLLPEFQKEGKKYVTISIGCTGGRHRSVAIADIIADYIKRKGYRITKIHRDIEKEK